MRGHLKIVVNRIGLSVQWWQDPWPTHVVTLYWPRIRVHNWNGIRTRRRR